MDNSKRFDQVESMLVDLLRKQDQHTDLLTQIITELGRHGEVLGQHGEALGRQGKLLTSVSE